MAQAAGVLYNVLNATKSVRDEVLFDASPYPPWSDQMTAQFKSWRDRGLSVRAARVLTMTGCDTVEDIRRKGRHAYYGIPNCGNATLREIDRLVGGWAEEDPTEPSVSMDDAMRIVRGIVRLMVQHGYTVLWRRP